jgi:hypothetical protein
MHITFLASFYVFSHKEPHDSLVRPKHVAYVEIQRSSFGDVGTSDPQSALAYCTVVFIM